jgi:hypothetical protein
MKILGFGLLATGLLAVQPVAGQAQDGPMLLEPITDWETQRLDDRCVLRRSFGELATPTVLELRRIDPWDGGFHAAVTSSQVELIRAPFKAAWLPGGREGLADLPTYEKDSSGREWVEFPHGLWDGMLDSLEGADLTAYFREGGPDRFQQQVETFQIDGAFGQSIALQTGPMDGVIAAANQCMEEMLAARGIHPNDMRRGDSRAVVRRIPSQQRIWNRLPDRIKSRARPSMVDFLLYLDSAGRPTSCRLSRAAKDGLSQGCTFRIDPASEPEMQMPWLARTDAGYRHRQRTALDRKSPSGNRESFARLGERWTDPNEVLGQGPLQGTRNTRP